MSGLNLNCSNFDDGIALGTEPSGLNIQSHIIGERTALFCLHTLGNESLCCFTKALANIPCLRNTFREWSTHENDTIEIDR